MWEGEEGRSLHANKGGQESGRGDEREIMERGGGEGLTKPTTNKGRLPPMPFIKRRLLCVRLAPSSSSSRRPSERARTTESEDGRE